MTTRLICTDGGSNKFWEGRVEGSTLRVRWGKLGTNGQTKDKPHVDAATAERELQKLIAEKLTKGYRHDDGSEAVEVASDTKITPDAASPPASAPIDKPKKVKKSSLTVKAAKAMLAAGNVASVSAAIAKDPGVLERLASVAMELFTKPESGQSPEGARDHRAVLLALLDAGLSPSTVAAGVASTSWVLETPDKIELLEAHWDKLDTGARRDVVESFILSLDESRIEFVMRRADVESALLVLRHHSRTTPEAFARLLARFSPTELDHTSDHPFYEVWLGDKRGRLHNNAYGWGLVHQAVSVAGPSFLSVLLERGANPALPTTQPNECVVPSSRHPLKGGDFVTFELPVGATALDIAMRCHQILADVIRASAAACESAIGSEKLRSARNQAEQKTTLDRYREIVELLQSRGVAPNPVMTRAAKPTYDVNAALAQYLALCEALGQDVTAARAQASRVDAPTSVVSYWRALAEDNKALHAQLRDDGLAGLLVESREFYDDSYLSGDAAKVAGRGELLHAVDADAWYDVKGVIYRVHPEGSSKVGTYAECMALLREKLSASA